MKRILLFAFSLLLFFACKEEKTINDEFCAPTPPSLQRKVVLVIKNADGFASVDLNNGISKISNLLILLFNANGKCIQTTPLQNVEFDNNNTFATTLLVPSTTTSITVMGNALGNTYPAPHLFNNQSVSDIYLLTSYAPTGKRNYFIEPPQIYEGTKSVQNLSTDEDISLRVDISRSISNIIVRLDPNLKFGHNNGKGFEVTNSPQSIYINGIDTLFVVDTPVGVDLSFSKYFENLYGFKSAQIVKPSLFASINNIATDSCFVFPQIGATKLPYLIFSVTGTKGTKKIDKNNPLYYGMRIDNLISAPGVPIRMTSLPRNVVVVVTITGFKGIGNSTPPDPDTQSTINLTAVVQSWSDYYRSQGDAQ